MKKCLFTKCQFAGSYLESFPELRSKNGAILPEVALVGRSNVGKSSLLNHLLRHKGLARVSKSPGKTQTINYFNVDDQINIVDLPGYGFAKRARALQEKWAPAIDHYFRERPSLKLVLFLLDSRREPSEEDIAFLDWIYSLEISFTIVFTKSDTLKQAEIQKNIFKSLGVLKHSDFISYSIKDGEARRSLIEKINRKIYASFE